jgi:hypothetical protein
MDPLIGSTIQHTYHPFLQTCNDSYGKLENAISRVSSLQELLERPLVF